MAEVIVIEGCAVVTMDAQRRELADGHVVCEGNRIAAVGAGAAPTAWTEIASRSVDGRGRLATPGLVNCHHHLYQWATRGLAQESTLFEWLTALYPIWAHIDEDVVLAAARAGIGALLRSGATMSSDHHYVFPHDGGDLLAAEVTAARDLGIRFAPCRGAMDLGRSHGGLPPDNLVEDIEAALAASEDAIARFHDPAPGSMVRVALAPTSPFSVTADLLAETATLARSHGVRLHTHLAETREEEEFCRQEFGMRPLEYLEDLGWVGDDVWLAHCVHLDDDECARMGAAGTGVAHCPTSNGRLGAGIAPVPRLLAAGVAVGLGVDGAASNECGELAAELRSALVLGRAAAGPAALTARQVLEMATLHGARCLGREDELGHLSVGALADVALWRLDEAGFAGIADPVAALVMGPTRPVDALLVNGRVVVVDGNLLTADDGALGVDLARQSARMREVAPG
jgi:cytosine/adenosine deaminase-related metal-dependent hydrolase